MSIIDSTTETRRKKLEYLEQARRRYIQMLYGYLPCLAMPDEVQIAHEAIALIKHIADWHEVALVGNRPKTYAVSDGGYAASSSLEALTPTLTTEEADELRVLIGKYQIYVAKDPDTQEMTMTHPFISGAFHPLNEREVLDVARDIARQAGGA